MVLRKFLSWCYKNADDKRELVLRKKTALRNRLLYVHDIDTEIERGFCTISTHFRNGLGYFNSLNLSGKH